MILHIAPDQKFIDMGLRVFEKCYPEKNHCIIVTDNTDLSFVKFNNVTLTPKSDISTERFTKLLIQYDAIILHSLFSLEINLPKGVPVAWIGWGYDYYDLIYSTGLDFYDEKSKQIAIELIQSNNTTKIKQYIKKLPYIPALIYKLRRHKKIKYINSSINYFLPVLESEFNQVKNNCIAFKPKYLDWNYGTLEFDLLKGYELSTITSDNILIGNSATCTNNHVEVFDMISEYGIKDQKLIIPLSYGDSIYRDKIKLIANSAFKNQAITIVDFMPIDKYIELISSCGFVIMNHIRQQALGNIVIMLYLGAKVFIKEVNPIYSFFKSKGGIVFSIEELEADSSLLNSRLEQVHVARNRAVVREVWCENVILDKTKVVAGTLLNVK